MIVTSSIADKQLSVRYLESTSGFPAVMFQVYNETTLLGNGTLNSDAMAAFDNQSNSSTSSSPSAADQLDLLAVYNYYLPAITAVARYATLLWYVIGYPGNILSMIIWVQRRMRQSSGCYLAALAVSDFVFLLLHIVYELATAWQIPVLAKSGPCEIYPILFYTSQYLSPLLVLAFTVERYISICHPFQRDKFCTTRRAVTVIVCLAVGSLMLHAVQGYFWHYSAEHNKCDLREEVMSIFFVWTYVTEMLVFLAVPAANLVLNVIVIVATQRIKARETKMTISGRKSVFHHKPSVTTVTLLAVSFYHIATTLPATIVYVLHHIFPYGSVEVPFDEVGNDPTWTRHLVYYGARQIVDEICMSHYAGNFLIYVATGSAFRVELRRLFDRALSKLTSSMCCKRRQHKRLSRRRDDRFSTSAAPNDGRLNRTDSVTTANTCRVDSVLIKDRVDDIEDIEMKTVLLCGNGHGAPKIVALTTETVMNEAILLGVGDDAPVRVDSNGDVGNGDFGNGDVSNGRICDFDKELIVSRDNDDDDHVSIGPA